MIEHDAEKRSTASLCERLRARIKSSGPISFSEWMRAALYDESAGYYCRVDLPRWGRFGDYRTSAERSKLFAATFARYFARLYRELGSPERLTILEAGAGAGRFAADALETLQKHFPEIFRVTHYILDEASVDAQERARKQLAPFKDSVAFMRLENLPEKIAAGIIFSNELLDAMPVHRVVMREQGISELGVGLDEAGEFVWVEMERVTPQLENHFSELGVWPAVGHYAEVNLNAADWLCNAAAALQRGYVISVDYGAEAAELFQDPPRRMGTLRAFRRHRLTDNVLDEPGAQDITSTVNWTQLRLAGMRCGLETLSLERQDSFLMRAGLLEQLELMADAQANDAESVILRTSAREMILPGGMSSSFQVLVQRRL